MKENTLTVSGLDDNVLGTQCTVEIEAGATLDTTSVTNFKVTSSQDTTTLNVYGTMNAAKVTIEANGRF